MTEIPYNKPAISYDEQLKKLRDRGLIIDDERLALHRLQHCGYYRLSAYWRPFQANHETHEFQPGIKFESILRLYDFDRRLRLLLLDAIECIEVSFRSQWAHELGRRHGPHAHLESSISKNLSHWENNKSGLKKEVERSREIFIKHLVDKYSEELPPIWASCEVMSLGLLSRWYRNLKPLATRSAIASVYELDQAVLESWLHHLTILRNICAHHSRLWNRKFNHAHPKFTKNKPTKLIDQFIPDHCLYNSFVILLYMMDVSMIKSQWRKKLKTLLLNHKDCLSEMGFPDDWQSKGIWKMG